MFIDNWARGVIWLRVVLSALFIPLWAFGLIVFQEGRIWRAPALVLLIYLFWRDVRKIRSGTHGAFEGPPG